LNSVIEDTPRLKREGASAKLKESGMELPEILAGAEISTVSGPADVEIRLIAYDSRKVAPGALFFAFHGQKMDGLEFVADAVARGSNCCRGPHGRGWRALLPIFMGIPHMG
jgi:hypothetical protein